MNIKILSSYYYFEREMYLVTINGKYAKIYKGSGLNGRKRGLVLPYSFLQTKKTKIGDGMKGVVSGYIWKCFYYRGFFTKHRKNPVDNTMFPLETESLLNKIQEKLDKIILKEENQDIEDVLDIAKKIELDMNQIIENNNLKIFDWFKDLKKGIN